MTSFSDNYNGGRQLSWGWMQGGQLLDVSGTDLVLGAGHGSSGTFFAESVIADLATDNHSAQDDVLYISTGGDVFGFAGPLIRCNDIAQDFYWCGLDPRDGVAFIGKMVAGVNSDGPSSSFSWGGTGVSHTIKFAASGTTTTHLSMVVDGTEVLTWNDTTSPLFGSTHRRVGHVGWYNPGTDFTWHYDNFTATDTPGGSPSSLALAPAVVASSAVALGGPALGGAEAHTAVASTFFIGLSATVFGTKVEFPSLIVADSVQISIGLSASVRGTAEAGIVPPPLWTPRVASTVLL